MADLPPEIMSDLTSSREVEIEKKQVGPGYPTFLVAEAGSNHNGDLNLARSLVDIAAKAGVDAVKFQLFQAEELYPSNCGPVSTPGGPVDYYEVLKHLSLPRDWITELKAYTEQRNLIFLCTPFDESGVDYLGSRNVAAFKIASPELNHLPLLRAAARYRKPFICSTGISLLSDIEEALQTIRRYWPAAGVVLLHCISAYPLPVDEANLRLIQTLQSAFGLPTGFSDHTTDPEMIPSAAVALGACMIEKHYTLDRSLPGPDHAFALQPAELTAMVHAVREIEHIEPSQRLTWVKGRFGGEKINAALGHGRKEIMPAERDLYPNDKRSIRVIQNVPAGEILSPENVRILRSERNLEPGIHPRYWEIVLGGRAVRTLAAGKGICWEDLIQR